MTTKWSSELSALVEQIREQQRIVLELVEEVKRTPVAEQPGPRPTYARLAEASRELIRLRGAFALQCEQEAGLCEPVKVPA